MITWGWGQNKYFYKNTASNGDAKTRRKYLQGGSNMEEEGSEQSQRILRFLYRLVTAKKY